MDEATWAKPFDCHWKSMESWVGMKHVSFCSGCNLLFLRVFSMTDGLLNTPNMLPNMVYGQAFLIVTRQATVE